jgi:ATP-binding cassette subfamily D (ALD) long-chain fatty acid import protein
MSDLQARGNAYLGKSVQNILSFYARRRKKILRISYLIIIYMLFNNGSKSKKKSQDLKDNSVPSFQDLSNKTFIQRIIYKFKSSPTIILFSQLNIKDKNTIYSFYQLILQISLLLTKALITLKIATLDGDLVSSLISRKFKKFFKFLFLWLLIGIPSSITDSLLEKSKRLLSQSIRNNLTNKLLDDYLPSNGNSTIYQLLNHKNTHSNYINDPNHRLTTTIENFADSFSILPSQLLTPISDILIAANHMSKSSENSSEGALLLGMVANLSTLVLKFFTPNFSNLNNLRNTLENKFHEFHSNIILNNEEIALAKGHSREIDLLDTSYFEFEKFERMSLRRMAVYNFAISFIFKYTLGAFGLMLCAVPTFTSVYLTNIKKDEQLVSKLSADFVANRSLLLKASESLGKLIQSKKNIQNMVGYAGELCEFQNALVDINESSKIESAINYNNDNNNSLINDSNIQPLLVGPNVNYGNEISFHNIPLKTPNDNLLVKDLSFHIKQGDNLLIIGPNGCGKSSLFRILGGLWDVEDPGKIIVPYDKRDLFYLPQRSYFTYGTLREQIIYPDSYDDYREKILKTKQENPEIKVQDDEYLVELLRKVNLEYLLNFEYQPDSDDSDDETISLIDNSNNTSSCIFMMPCLDRVEKWPDLLSVGEQQRLAMIRLYYHKPKFAVLDECTSSISSDLERECYRIAIEDLKITVLSVCHRTSLWTFHSKILKFKRTTDEEKKNGLGAATTLFTSFDPELRLKRHEELISIDNSLKRSDELNKRLNALKNMKNSRSGRRQALMYIDDED